MPEKPYTADERKRMFEAVSDFVADRKMREARNPTPAGYSPFSPSHRANERRSRRAKRD
ncbi:MAG TPA: hypothetical protein VF760_01790 [Xanthobacteraceae bacterium]